MSESETAERRHSSACIDATECDGVDHCICLPAEEAPAPDAYELWWCSYCGEPSCEDSDPCQRCGEKIERVPLVSRASAVREVVEWLENRPKWGSRAFLIGEIERHFGVEP